MASRSSGLDMSIRFSDLSLPGMVDNVVEFDDRLDRGVAGIVKQRSHIAEEWMRTNAPWTDRTGNARSGLSSTTEHEPKVHHTLVLFGRVPYQIWLEIRFAGRYAIIIPAILDQGPKMMRTMVKLIDRLKGGLASG
jgi:hypothetical protein